MPSSSSRRVSPTAFRLAGFLAAAPLSFPVMRLVQQVMLPVGVPATSPRFS